MILMTHLPPRCRVLSGLTFDFRLCFPEQHPMTLIDMLISYRDTLRRCRRSIIEAQGEEGVHFLLAFADGVATCNRKLSILLLSHA